MRRWFTLLSLALLCAGSALAAKPAPAVEDPFGKVAKAYLVEIDGQIVWQKNATQRLPQASLTKLMTALLVAEQLPADAPVRVDSAAAHETGSKLGLVAGDTLRAQDLLAATLIASANDACRALANHLAANEAEFAKQMNRRAQQMGLRNTRFTNACGHDAPGHFSSVTDLQVLAHAVMLNAPIAALVGKADLQISTTGGGRQFALVNKNALIGRYPGAIGVKTGTTPQAGKCLVAMAKRGPHTVLLVLLQGKDRWWDAVDLLDIAFARADAPQ